MSALFAAVVVAATGTAAVKTEEIRELRKQAAFRPRRIIFNNDGDDVFAVNKDASIKTFLAARTTALLGSQVDAIAYSTTRSFAFFTHDTKVCEVFTRKEGRLANNITPDLVARGLAPLQVMIAFCRQNDMEQVSRPVHDEDYDQDHDEDAPRTRKTTMKMTTRSTAAAQRPLLPSEVLGEA